MSRSRLRKQIRDFVRARKNKKCADCKIHYPPKEMSYDHVSGKKLFNLGGSLLNRTKEEVVAEIAKCDVVCISCHRAREALRIEAITG